MITANGTRSKKCPYCGRNFKVAKAYVNSHDDQEKARSIVRRFNEQL